ncbi:lysozyme-like protein [Rhizobium phage RHph_X2_26]|nr:lysozyme-like protein [Rhizobium phage RHph_X2_26]
MNYGSKTFFTYVRRAPFGGRLETKQVEGINAVLDACEEFNVEDIDFIAYMLATSFHETGGTMQPVEENLSYSYGRMMEVFGKRLEAKFRHDPKAGAKIKALAKNPRGLANAVYGGRNGNTGPDDGWRYRGRGLPQLTFRDNYAKFGLADNPDAMRTLKTAARVMVEGMTGGKFTGKSLEDFRKADGSFDAVGARATVNGTDKAKLIATHYSAFREALLKGREAIETESLPASVAALPGGDEPDDVPPGKSVNVAAIAGGIGVSGVTTLVSAISNPFALVAFVAILGVASVFGYMVYTGKLKEFRK